MTPTSRSLVAAAALVCAGALAGCSSGGSDAAPSTTRATTDATSTSTEATTSTTDDATTTTNTADTPGTPTSVDCQALLQEYSEVFDPDDLTETVAFFRSYEPDMPPEVAAATERLAVAYEDAGDLGNLNMGDVDLTADAQTFSDWTNDGCPAA